MERNNLKKRMKGIKDRECLSEIELSLKWERERELREILGE